MNDSFDSLPWHDAAMREISIDRRSPGLRDEIRIEVMWPDGREAALVFKDCYALAAEMNFGVIAEERIASAQLLEDDATLAAIRERWKPLGVSLDTLRCYRVETSSTSSTVRIYALQFEIVWPAD